MAIDLFEDVAARAGGIPRETAARVTVATVAALQALLPRVDGEALATLLPPRRRPRPARGHGDLFLVVARRARVRRVVAIEVGEVACSALAARLSPEARERAIRHLPPDLAGLFEPPAPGIVQSPPSHAQRESIAAAANPHEDTKLSSGHALADELGTETLAGGRPGSERPLSGEGR